MKKLTSLLSLVLISTIAFSVPLSGTYTIGGTSPDYATFNAAVNDLVANGVSGNVTFNVRPGTYNEQIAIGTVSGASASNVITFTSESGIASDVILTYAATSSSNNYLVKLTQCSYITFDYLTFTSTGNSYSTIFYIENSSLYYTITNSKLNAPAATSTTVDQSIFVNSSNTGANCSYGIINYNTFNGGSYAMYFLGNCSLSDCYINYTDIMHNSFSNQYAYGIYQFRCLTSMIKYNTLTTDVTNSSYHAMYFNIFFYDTVANNIIYNCPGNGIWHDNGDPRIFNNFIHMIGTGVNYGLTFTNLNYSATTAMLGANTVLCMNTNPGSSAFYMPYGYEQPVNFVINNNFVNRGGGYAVYIMATGELAYPNSWGVQTMLNNNNYYTTGTYLGNWGGTNCATLSDWQSTVSGCGCGGDANSTNIDPSFVSNTDLHLTVDNMGNGYYHSMIPYDIDLEDRNNSAPDIGADEFGNVACNVNAGSISGTSNVACYNSTMQLTLSGNTSGTSIQWQSGTTAGNFSPISGATSSTYQTNQLTQLTYFYVIATAGACADTTLAFTIDVMSPVQAGTISSSADTICKDETVDLTLNGNSGTTIQWQSGNTIGNYSDISGANSIAYTTAPLSETTYFVAIVSSGVCYDTAGYYEIVVVNPVAGFTSAVENFDASFSSSTSSGATSFTWDFGDGTISNDPDPTHVYDTAGTYVVCLTVSSGGCSDSVCHNIVIEDTFTNILTNPLSNWNIYPNPTDDYFFIEGNISNVNGIEVFDMVGRKLLYVENALNGNEIKLDVREFRQGIYYLKIKTLSGSYLHAIVKN